MAQDGRLPLLKVRCSTTELADLGIYTQQLTGFIESTVSRCCQPFLPSVLPRRVPSCVWQRIPASSRRCVPDDSVDHHRVPHCTPVHIADRRAEAPAPPPRSGGRGELFPADGQEVCPRLRRCRPPPVRSRTRPQRGCPLGRGVERARFTPSPLGRVQLEVRGRVDGD